MKLLDPRASRAVLIGTSKYTHLPDLPAVSKNIARLQQILTDTDLWGLRPEHCVTLLDRDSPPAVAKAVRLAAAEVSEGGLLLVYYAGHGLIDPVDRRLVLALTDTEQIAPAEAGLPFERIRQGIARSPAESRLAILDCCYAGLAGDTGMMGAGGNEAQAIADLAMVDQTCLLVAASRTGRALAPEGEEHTAFTGEILRVLGDGIPNGPALLTVGLVWRQVLRALRTKGGETPEIRSGNGGEEIVLARNAALRRRDLTGSVLAAAPDVHDRDLQGSVILVLRHAVDKGAIGIRLNRRSEVAPAVPPDWRHLLTEPRVVFDGGPVSNGTSEGYIAAVLLRANEKEPVRFQPVRDRFGIVPLTSDPRDLEHRLRGARLYSGYLGWGPGELERDLDRGALIQVQRSMHLLPTHPHEMWAAARS